MTQKIHVHVKLKSKKEAVEQLEDSSFIVRCNAPPVEGKANKKVIELLSKYLKVPKSHFNLVKGHSCKLKVFVIN